MLSHSLAAEYESFGAEPTSAASDHSDVMPNPVLFERELAHRELQEELAARERREADGSRAPTINYEEALERELEYQKHINMILLQNPNVGYGLYPLHQSPSKLSFVGIKRKGVDGELLEPASQGSYNQSLSPKQVQDGQTAGHLLGSKNPSLRQLQEQRPSVQQSHCQRPLHQGLSYTPLTAQGQHSQGQQSVQRSQDQQPLPQPPPSFQLQRPIMQQSQHQIPLPFAQSANYRQPSSQPLRGRRPLLRQTQTMPLQPNYNTNPVWCHLCNVKCVTPHNLMIHIQGKKHKAKCDAVRGLRTGTTSSNT